MRPTRLFRNKIWTRIGSEIAVLYRIDFRNISSWRVNRLPASYWSPPISVRYSKMWVLASFVCRYYLILCWVVYVGALPLNCFDTEVYFILIRNNPSWWTRTCLIMSIVFDISIYNALNNCNAVLIIDSRCNMLTI